MSIVCRWSRMLGLIVPLSFSTVFLCQAMPVRGTFAGGVSFDGGEIGIHAKLPGWGNAQYGCNWDKIAEASQKFSIRSGNVRYFDCESIWRGRADGSLAGTFSLSCVADCELQCLALAAEFKIAPVVGRTWKADDVSRVLPATVNNSSGFGDGIARRFEFPLPNGASLTLVFSDPVRYHAQDSRQWGSNWSVRFGNRSRLYKYSKGERISWNVSISSEGGVQFEHSKPCIVKEGDGWVRMSCLRDVLPGSALDFSGMCLQDAPAGKYGWLRNVSGEFEFERKPGETQRFYGVNLSHAANYLSHAEADRLTDRFVRIGYNSIRIHHYDRFWDDVENREKLDYLVARAIEKGLYITTDLYVSRVIKWREVGIERDGDMDKTDFKRLIATDDAVFQNWCAFAREFLEHVNPYTGRAYKDEPAMPLISLVNEGGESIETWKRCSSFVRSLGAKALLTNDNDGLRHADGEGIVSNYDYVDTHSYVDHPTFLDGDWTLPSRCDNGNPVLSGRPDIFLKALSCHSVKPHVASEWNFSGPGRYRSLAGLIIGTQSALLDWDGLWRFAYSHSDRDLEDYEGSTPDYFNIVNDPVMQATDRVGVCLYLRGDARDAGNTRYLPDPQTGGLRVITPLTCGGFSEGGDIDAGVLKVRVSGAPAAVWASSIDGKRLTESDRILLVHLTDVQADGTHYVDDSRKILYRLGRGHLLQDGEAKIALAVADPSAYRAYGLDTTGKRTCEIPTSVRNRHLVLTVSARGPTGGRIYYELIRNHDVKHAIYGQSDSLGISDAEMNAIYEKVNTPYKYGVVMQPEDGHMVDNPCVFAKNGKWFMIYIDFDGKGYETCLAESKDLLDWHPLGCIVKRGKENEWDCAQADAWPILLDCDWNGSNELQQFNGRYWGLYIGGGNEGYEADPLRTGVVWTDDPSVAKPWMKYPGPVLGPDDEDARWFEKKTIYKHCIVEDTKRSLGGRFISFYNAKEGLPMTERIGMAISDDLLHWKRVGAGPIIDDIGKGRGISGDPMIKKIGDVWVMFYFGFMWKQNVNGSFETFAASKNLKDWVRWKGDPLIKPSEKWDCKHAHKPWVIYHDGVVYHFYCAVGEKGRAIALATSKEFVR